MKKHFLYFAIGLFLLIAVNELKAQQRPFGIGVIIGEPTGISAKLWVSKINAFDFGLGWTVFNQRDDSRNRIHFHMDYLWHSFNAINSAERFPLYYGIGGRFIGRGENESSLAVRGVFGIAWLPRDTTIDIFIEIAPSLELTPSTGFAVDASIGLRVFL